MLAFGYVVVWEEVHFLRRGGKGEEEVRRGGEVCVIGIYAFDERDADPVGGFQLRKEAYVTEYMLIGDACIFLVEGWIHQFDIDKEEVADGGCAADGLRWHLQAGVHATVEAAPAHFLQQGEGVVRVKQRLSAAKRDASAAGFHHSPFFLYFLHQLVHRPVFAADFKGHRRADIGAGATEQAFFPGGDDALRRKLQRSHRAGLYAAAAANAAILLVHSLRLRAPAFRVMAPDAPQRAALEEYGCAYSGAVVQGVALYVKYQGHSGGLEFFVLGSGYDFFLELGGHIVEIVRVAGHAHKQVTVLVRMLLGVPQGICIYYIELDMMAAKAEIFADELAKFGDFTVRLEEGRSEAHVEQGAAASGLVQLAKGTDHRRGAVCVSAVGGRGAVGNGEMGEASVR